jgi:hypothetical protein
MDLERSMKHDRNNISQISENCGLIFSYNLLNNFKILHYLPLVCISIASTSFLLIRSEVVVASLTYVTSPGSIRKVFIV